MSKGSSSMLNLRGVVARVRPALEVANDAASWINSFVREAIRGFRLTT